jgi:Flp pilus assembly protein TadG
LRRLRTRCGLFNDERGVSAVEFALILPVMMVLFLAGVEITKAININRKVTLAASTLADLVARTDKVNAADIANVLKAGEVVSGLMNDPTLKMRVSSLNIDPQGVAKIEWSKALNQAGRAAGEVVTVPAGLKPTPPNERSLIWSEAEYVYKASIGGGTWFGYTLGQAFTLQATNYERARLKDKVICDNC